MDWRVAKLVAFVDSHDGGLGWNLEQACQELGLGISPAYAGKLFKRETGLGVREYAKMKRLSFAAERLTATNVPIKVIASGLGYRHVPDFTRFFKNQQLMPPASFRQARHVGE